jgi:hypothetical protein
MAGSILLGTSRTFSFQVGSVLIDVLPGLAFVGVFRMADIYVAVSVAEVLRGVLNNRTAVAPKVAMANRRRLVTMLMVVQKIEFLDY